MNEAYRKFYEENKHRIFGLIPPELTGLGDVVERVAHPIAKALNLPCLDKTTDTLKPESPCAKRRDAMNRLVPFGKSIN
jgi:hypothetical protein